MRQRQYLQIIGQRPRLVGTSCRQSQGFPILSLQMCVQIAHLRVTSMRSQSSVERTERTDRHSCES